MAQHVVLDKEKLICSICLDLQKDPVTIPCGHSYCLECIQNFWSGEEPKAPSCPQCRQSFTSRPVLVRNTILAELVEDHKLVKATLKLEGNICPRHDEVMKIFCRTDQKCICSLCSMDEHKGHDMVSAAAERAERQTKLGLDQQKVQQRILNLEEDLEVLQQAVEAINLSAEKTIKESQNLFKGLILRKVEELQEKMQHEITKLKKTEAELDQLSSTEDHLHFLNNYSSLSDLSVCTDLPRSRHTTKISDSVDVFLPEDFRSREDFVKFYRQITLDPNTANRNLSLSEQNRTATWTMIKQNYSSHPDRFAKRSQVLSAEGLTGRCYWEVEWSGWVFIAVAYKDISHTGTNDESAFGFNDKSWALRCSPTEYTFLHNNSWISIAAPRSSRVGVYLNHKAGSLSFYSPIYFNHTIQTFKVYGFKSTCTVILNYCSFFYVMCFVFPDEVEIGLVYCFPCRFRNWE
uniref:Tripartite motif-containing protein 16-like n=1 Tax=Oryzias latipes TaxID=8090 RepID=A0A3P9J0Y3_ORYLA